MANYVMEVNMDVLTKNNKINYDEVYNLIHNNSLPHQVKIAGNNSIEDLEHYLRDYDYLMFKKDNEYIGIVTFYTMKDGGCFIEDLVIEREIDNDSRKFIWGNIVEYFYKNEFIKYVKFSTYERLYPFYKRKFGFIDYNGFLYFFKPNLKFVHYKDFKMQKKTISDKEHVCLNYEDNCEIIDLETKKLIGVENKNYSIMTSLKYNNKIIINVKNFSEKENILITYEGEQITINPMENREIVLEPKITLENFIDEKIIVMVRFHFLNQLITLYPGYDLNKSFKIEIDYESHLLVDSYMVKDNVLQLKVNGKKYVDRYRLTEESNLIELFFKDKVIYNREIKLPFIPKSNLVFNYVKDRPVINKFSLKGSPNILRSNDTPVRDGNFSEIYYGIVPFIYCIDGFGTHFINGNWNLKLNSSNCITYVLDTNINSDKLNFHIEIKYKFINNDLIIESMCFNKNNWNIKVIVYIFCCLNDDFIESTVEKEYISEKCGLQCKFIPLTGVLSRGKLESYSKIPTFKNLLELLPYESSSNINVIKVSEINDSYDEHIHNENELMSLSG